MSRGRGLFQRPDIGVGSQSNNNQSNDDDWGWKEENAPSHLSPPKPSRGGSTSRGRGGFSSDVSDTTGFDGGRGRGGSGRGGGRGGRGGGSNSCFNCGDDGHMSRDCPSGGSGSRGGGSRGGRGGRGGGCFKCGEEGHMSRDCTSDNTSDNYGGGSSRGGSTSRGGGHSSMSNGFENGDNFGSSRGGRGGSRGGRGGSNLENDFNSLSMESSRGGRGGSRGGRGGSFNTNDNDGFGGGSSRGGSSSRGGRGGSSGGGNNTCYKCNEEGHMARDCPNSGGGGGGGSACYKCNEEGHMARECPNAPSGGRGGGGGACYKCNEEGHMARECPNAPSGGRAGGGGACFKCNEEGHMARECPNAGSADAAEHKPRADFIPADEEEADMPHVNSGINFDKYDSIPVDISGTNFEQYAAKRCFEDCNLPDILLKNLKAMDINKPTPIQKYGIPFLLGGRDLMACAQTGSGKTAAFLLPIMSKLMLTNDYHEPSLNERAAFPRVLIMAPTRELVRQTYDFALRLARGTPLKCRFTYGGLDVQHNYTQLKSGCDILVATPGRLLDFIQKVWIHLKEVKFFVLDEADRMLHTDGFNESVATVFSEFREETRPQVCMFSATFPVEIQYLAKTYLNDYIFLVIGKVGSANQDVEQEIIRVEDGEKLSTLIRYIEEFKTQKTLVFVETKRMTDFVGCSICELGVSATTLHGDRMQREREIALNQFKRGVSNVLVATSVAARGLDIPKVDNVINMDMPSDSDTYIHRIGRTGRCGNTGRAISFFQSPKDDPLSKDLIHILSQAQQNVPRWLQDVADSSGGFGFSGMGGNMRDTRSGVQSGKYHHTNDEFMQAGTNDEVPFVEDEEW